MEKEVHGYKCFNKDHTNRHGMKFIEGQTYTSPSPEVSFGNNSVSGFHMCRNLEDTFRYFPAREEEVSVASVTGRGNIITRDDEFYGFYDMYSVEEITINRFLTREEIISYFLKASTDRVCRFIQLFKLTEEEIALFSLAFADNITVLRYINYYHYCDKNAFTRNKIYIKDNK